MDAYADDVQLAARGERLGVLAGTVSGKEAVGEWFGDWFRHFDRGYRFDVEEAREVAGRVLLVANHHGHGRDSGVPVEERWAYAYTRPRRPHHARGDLGRPQRQDGGSGGTRPLNRHH